MFLYIIIAFVLFAVASIDLLRNRDIDTRIDFFEMLICFVPLLLMVSLRSVGFDYEGYENAFDVLGFSGNLDFFTAVDFEPGYILLNVLSPSFTFLIFIMGGVTLIIKYRLIIRISPFPIISLLILYLAFILNFEMGQIRQALAMSITLYSIQYLPNKKKFLFFLFIALLFHYSAFIFLLVLFIPTKIKKWYFYLLLMIVAIIIYFVLEPFILKLANFLPSFSGGKFMLYYEDEKGQIGISIPILSLKIILLTMFYSLKSRVTELQRPIYEYIFNIYFLSLFIYIAFAFFPQISGRGGAYFSIFEIILIPIILKAIDNVYYRIFVFIFIVAIYFVMFFSFLGKWGESFIPYKTFL